MRDSELAASIVDGDPGALAETYDKYADLLWSYSRSLLSDERQAAEAVADTFVIASSRLDVLPSRARFRAWLYAVARVECLRRMRAAKDERAPGSAERLRQTAQLLSTGEQQQLRALLAEAFTGLDEEERDIMQMVWHGLDLAEAATILGITRSDAYTLFTRARDQLEATVGVMLMGWSGYGGCDVFEETLYGRDSRLTPELRARLTRHILKCETCTESYHRQMRPSLMLALSVGALLSEAEDARAAAGQAPAGLWEQVYQATSAASPESRWHKILGGRRVTFGPDGFPRQLASGRDGIGGVKVAAVGAVAVAATAVGWGATHGHVAARPDASASSTRGVAPVSPQTQAAADATPSKGAHEGKPSTKTVSHHKAAHAKPQPAGSSPSALPSTATSGTSVPVSSGSTSSGSTSSGSTGSSGSTASGTTSTSSGSTSSGSTSTTSSGSSTSSGSGSTTSSGGSGSSSGGSSGGSGSGSGSTSTDPVSGVVKTVTGTVGGVTKTVGGILGG